MNKTVLKHNVIRIRKTIDPWWEIRIAPSRKDINVSGLFICFVLLADLIVINVKNVHLLVYAHLTISDIQCDTITTIKVYRCFLKSLS